MLSFLLSLRGAELAVQSWIVSGHGCDASYGGTKRNIPTMIDFVIPVVLMWEVLR